MKRTLAFAAIAAASSFTPASARDAVDDRVQVVSFADLDLSRQSDVRTLDRRIALAVAEVCGTGSDVDPAGKNDIRRCRVETTALLTAERERAIALNGRSRIVVAARER
jgi:UrcA family protein